MSIYRVWAVAPDSAPVVADVMSSAGRVVRRYNGFDRILSIVCDGRGVGAQAFDIVDYAFPYSDDEELRQLRVAAVLSAMCDLHSNAEGTAAACMEALGFDLSYY